MLLSVILLAIRPLISTTAILPFTASSPSMQSDTAFFPALCGAGRSVGTVDRSQAIS
jgi:hypothetical protein